MTNLDALEKLADEAAALWPDAAWYRDYEIRWGQYGSIDSEDAVFMQAANPAAIKALIAELKESRELLKPFAAMAEAGDQRPKDDAVWAGQDGLRITYGDFRAARAFLAKAQGGE